jgi:conjugal transfer/type IV secretion protein DotA/TraY
MLVMGQVLKYTLMPQVLPRVREFIGSGFSNLASFMAWAYRGARLLPDNHPYLQPGMAGKYGVADVLREASGNLDFRWKNIDQIIIFFALITGIIILGIQFILLLLTLMVNPASAGDMPANYGEFFVLDNRQDDLALRILDKVFGVPDIFGTSEPTETAFHVALHQLFQFYSIGLIVIAALIIIYFIFAIVAETAQTGTPFGRRYNHVWAPIRLVAAIGLLIPISYGMNSAQWITLYAAKFGSGFATNGWIKFNDTLDEMMLERDELVATPNPPALKDVVAFMFMVHACKQAYEIEKPEIITGGNFDAWIIDPTNAGREQRLSTINTPWSNAFTRDQEKIHIRFGEQDAAYSTYTSQVYPYCGEIVITNNEPGVAGTWVDDAGNNRVNATSQMTWAYYVLIEALWSGRGGDFAENAGEKIETEAIETMTFLMTNDNANMPPETFKKEVENGALEYIREQIDVAVDRAKDEYERDPNVERFGWGGAGIWYNEIANTNGRLTAAVMNVPTVSRYPEVMEYTCEENQQQNDETSPTECFNPRLAKGKETQYLSRVSEKVAKSMHSVFDYWYNDPDLITGNAFIDTINAVMGTQGLFDMCANADNHPLAQLASVGKGLVEAAIRNLGFAFGTGVAGILAPYFGPALQAASGLFTAVASIGILVGFILYYVIPFMPFLYFLFAVGGWVKGLFEAMVGVPLWALAHIRIDGQGLAGDAALNGYFLIFEIFIRPILIIFGLLASILIFAAMVRVLNEIFSLVVSNLSGFSTASSGICGTAFDSAGGAPTGAVDYMRGPVDEFFFTIVYAILVYMIGMSSFKLIDLIPNQILRWMGAGVSTFNDMAGEPAEGLVTKLAVGGGIMGGQLQSAASAAGQSVGGLGGAVAKFAKGGQ